MDLRRHHRFVEIGDEVRIGDVAKRLDALFPEADEIDEGIVAITRGALEQLAETALQLHGDAPPLFGRHAIELLAKEPLPEALDGFVGFVGHRSTSSRAVRLPVPQPQPCPD